jgi:hypothetical protein
MRKNNKNLNKIIPIVFLPLSQTILIFLIFVFVSSCFREKIVMNQRQQIQHQILMETSEQLKNEMNLEFLGFGTGFDEGLEMLSLSFSTDDSYDILLGRKLIVFCGEIFLKNINSNEKFKPYLKNFPFTSKNIEIFISVGNKNRKNKYNEYNLKALDLHKNFIKYEIYDENENLKTIHKETYEEALKIVQSENEKK